MTRHTMLAAAVAFALMFGSSAKAGDEVHIAGAGTQSGLKLGVWPITPPIS
jgi:hypothetical protein